MQYSDELYILSTLNEILSIRRMENDNSAMFSIEIVGVMHKLIPRPIFHRMFQRPYQYATSKLSFKSISLNSGSNQFQLIAKHSHGITLNKYYASRLMEKC